MRAFLRRPYHLFLSYSHKDLAFATDLRHWLSDTAGLRVWFDDSDLRSGHRVQADIASSISQCQGIVFLLSHNSLPSQYVQDELDQALAEKKEHSRFQIILLRLDDCDVAGQWKAIRHLKWHELATPEGPKLTLSAAAEILCRIHAYDGWQRRQDELKEVYVSRGWREGEEVFADQVCRLLAARGLRLVGDLPDQPKTDPRRIAGIMRGCCGHALLLPPRDSGRGPEESYKHFVGERRLSEELRLPVAVFVEPGSLLPAPLAGEAFVVQQEMLDPDAGGSGALKAQIYDFVECLVAPQQEAYAFLASEYEGNEHRNALARAVVEATGSLPCRWGKEYGGMDIQGTIREAIAAARFVVADLTAPDHSASGAGAARVNVNSCVEAGIAWGANVRLSLLAAANPDAANAPLEGKTRHVPFMFRNAQLSLYDDSPRSLESGVEFLGWIHRAVLDDREKFGRRVINYEL